MKLKKLTFSAFGPYKTQQTINFQKLSNETIFLITGDTGAGKTTIFDAICFALFGEASGQRKDPKTLKSDFSNFKNICFVELEFEVNNKKYKIKREPEQLVEKNKTKGLKLQKHKAELTLPDGTVKTNLKDIYNILVNEVLGVDKENFNKLIMLPQGQFQKLLTEKGQEQVNTFRKIFGTKIYEEIENKLFEEKQNVKKEYYFKVNENLKKLEDYILEDENIEKIKDLNFSEKLNFLLENNVKENEELKQLELKIKKLYVKIKDLQSKLALKEQFEKKEREKIKLKEKREALKKQFKDFDCCVKKKQLLYKIENLKTYYDIWSEKKQQIKEKRSRLEGLEKEFEKQNEKFEYILSCFEKISYFEKEKEKLAKKHSEILIMLNNFNLAEEFEVKIKLAEKELVNLEKTKKHLETKIELKTLTLEVEEKSKINKICKNIVSLNKEFLSLQKSLKNLNIKYLTACKNFYENQAFNLAKGLKEGKACPVCGSLTHPSPKKSASFEAVSESLLNSLRDEIFKKKDCLNAVYVKIKTLIVGLKEFENFEHYFEDTKQKQLIYFLNNFLKESLEEETKKTKLLKQKIKQQGENFRLNLKENYETLLVKNVADCEKFQAHILNLKFQKEELLHKIPKNLQNKSALVKKEQDVLKNKKNLEEKVYNITKQKETQEKKLNYFKMQKKALEQNILEAEKEEKSFKEQFFLKLDSAQISFEEALKFFDEFESLKIFVADFENYLKEQETINLKIKTIEEDLKLFNSKDFYGIKEQKEKFEEELNSLQEREKILIKRVAINTNCIFEIERNLKTIEKLEEKFKVAKILSDVAKGNKKRIGFEKYVLTSCLNEVLMFSNDWFKKLTANRFCFACLKSSDVLNFNVFDAYSGKIRHVSTLSGGETFAASLALCLGQCLRVSTLCGGIELKQC